MNIDWNRLWREARAGKTWQGKTKDDWNRRAAGFAKRNTASPYVREFIARLPLEPGMTVLDMGSGPGSVALPLSAKVGKVTAVDFSPEMLAVLEERLREQGIDNIRAVEGSWTDDWSALGIGVHDLVIASRSLAVDDLKSALEKLDSHAAKAVVIAERVGPGPFDPALFEAVGRRFVAGPDYIYTVNILYQMGIRASVDFIRAGGPRRYESRQAAVESSAWMLGDLSGDEEARLRAYFDRRLRRRPDGSWIVTGEHCPEWAVISWKKQGGAP